MMQLNLIIFCIHLSLFSGKLSFNIYSTPNMPLLNKHKYDRRFAKQKLQRTSQIQHIFYVFWDMPFIFWIRCFIFAFADIVSS